MEGSRNRVMKMFRGEKPDRIPMHEVICNDSVISHFGGESITVENGYEVAYKASISAIDCCRCIPVPRKEEEGTYPDGRKYRIERWTAWHETAKFKTVEDYVARQKNEMNGKAEFSHEDQQEIEGIINDNKKNLSDNLFYMPGGCWGTQLSWLSEHVGLDNFSLYIYDCPEIVSEMLEFYTAKAIQKIEMLPDDHGINAVFYGEDIAFTNGPMFSPDFFEKEYYYRMKKVIEAYHKKNIYVMFHSDGNLNLLMDGLVDMGIDAFNPIEVLAGMDIADLHKRYPNLILAGGIDASQLLPFGKPQEVKDAVNKAIEDSEGKIMIGSSTEVHNAVPLENYLAMRTAVLEYQM